MDIISIQKSMIIDYEFKFIYKHVKLLVSKRYIGFLTRMLNSSNRHAGYCNN